MLATSNPGPDRHRLRRRPPGGRCQGLLLPATLAQHLGLQELADNCVDLGDALRGGRTPATNSADPGRLGARGRRVHRRRRCVARRRDGERARLHRQGRRPPSVSSCAASAGATSASSTASADKLLAPRLGGRGGTGRRVRSRSTSIRRSARPTAWRRRAPGSTATRACAAITRCSPLRPGRVTCSMARLREGRANTARGAAHFLRETVGRVRAAGASGELTAARRQRLLQPRRRRRVPQAGCPLLNHHSPAAERTRADRGDPGRGLRRRSHTGCPARRGNCRRD